MVRAAVVWHNCEAVPDLQEEWEDFQHDYLSEDDAFHTRLKIRDDGPYAFLVQEALFSPEQLRHWDYLEIPEAVDDICNYYQEKQGQDLGARFVAATCPCIVKFQSTPEDSYELQQALNYIAGALPNLAYTGPPVERAAIVSVSCGSKGETGGDWHRRLLSVEGEASHG